MKEEQLELVRLAEQNLLGALLVCGANGDIEPMNKVRFTITPDDFLPSYREKLHHRIYWAMLNSPQTDQITVAQTMFDKAMLQPKEIAYMSSLVSEVIGIEYEDYAKIVRENALLWRTGSNKSLFKGGV